MQHPPLVASVLARTLSARGCGLLTDPGRRTAGSFIDECAKLGLHAERVTEVPAEHGPAKLTVSVFEIRRG